MKKNVLTKSGYETLLEELLNLKNQELPQIIEAVKEAKEAGDLSENAEYHAAKEKLGLINNRISEIEYMLEDVEIVEEDDLSDDNSIVSFGSTVVIETEEGKQYTIDIVGSGEVQVENSLKISFESPIGNAIQGKKKGDVVKVRLGSGRTSMKIVDIR